MLRISVYLLCFASLACLASCGGRSTKQPANAQPAAPAPKSYHFRMVQPPALATDEDKFAYMAEHYWDKFDFSDTLFIAHADTVEMARAYAVYIANFVGATDQQPIRALMQRASTSKKMFDYFVMLAEKVLHDPNSPVRSEELYIPVLEAQLATPFYDEYERLAPDYDLQLARQNRIGHRANDFRYTLASGRSSTLYALRADYVLIFINNPGCPMCKQIQTAIGESQMLTDLLAKGTLKVLALYPDRDLEAWRKYAPTMPAQWINSYDKGCVIESRRLYDLRAIPAMYLLDARKTVLVRDSTSVPEIEQAIVAASADRQNL